MRHGRVTVLDLITLNSTFVERECPVDTKTMEKLGHCFLINPRFIPDVSRNMW
jgi:hypothetical protein